MPHSTDLTCRCGKVHIAITGAPILSAECECDSCRKGGAYLASLPGGKPVAGPTGGTHYVLCRKDRVQFTAGAEHLVGYRLTDKSHTRRVVAGCCNTPLFVEFEQGHWLSMFADLWPAAVRPRAEMRTMVSDLPAGTTLPTDIPNHKTQSVGFFVKLLGAWVAMGFKVPAIVVPNETVMNAA
jgi:hypothetical protein